LIKTLQNQETEIIDNLNSAYVEKQKKFYMKLDYLHDLKLRLNNLLQEFNLYQTYYLFPTSSDTEQNLSHKTILPLQSLVAQLNNEKQLLQSSLFPYNISFSSKDIELLSAMKEKDFRFLHNKLHSFGLNKFPIPLLQKSKIYQHLESLTMMNDMHLFSQSPPQDTDPQSTASAHSLTTPPTLLTANDVYERILYDFILEGRTTKTTSTAIPTHYEMKGPFQLLYQSSKDGFSLEKFHQLCGDKGSLLIIIEDTENNIFGAYSAVSWSSPESPQYFPDYSQSSFLFTVKNPHQLKPMKFPLKADKIQEAIFFSKEFGPVFGAGHDFLMTDMSTVSFANSSYEIPSEIEFQELVFANRTTVDVLEMEVWKID
jgi:hypothetical protein